MFKKILKRIVCILALFVLTYSTVAAGTISINDLIENSIEYDSQTVTVEGEAIGEALERDGHAWVNINDGGNAIGIWMTLDDAGKIQNFGDYKNKGDIIRITGVFSRNCPQHGGDIDIHCRIFETVTVGQHISENVSFTKSVIAICFFILAALALVYYFKRLKRKKV
jgi:hypothetical protein